MKIRDAVLDDQHTFITPARTWTFPIDVVDPVTEFKVMFQIYTDPTPDTSTPWTWPEPMPYMVKEIAIIDGSEVIYALPGPLAFSLSSFDLGFTAYHVHNEHPDRVNRWCFPIHFGRSLVDPNWIFDPGRFRNPQLRITWDAEWATALGDGAYKCEEASPITISVWAKIMEEGAAPVGYLMSKVVKEYTPTGDGNEITWLPTDFPHRKLLVRSYQFGGWMTHNITHLKLSQDQDKWIPFDHRSYDFIRLMKNWFTEVQMHGYHYVENDAQREHLCGDLSSGLVVSSAQSRIVGPTNWLGNTFKVYAVTETGAGVLNTARTEVWSQGMTRTPLDCFCYPFGDQDDPADWLQVAPMGNLRLILTHLEETWEGTVDNYALTQIVSQQAHPY